MKNIPLFIQKGRYVVFHPYPVDFSISIWATICDFQQCGILINVDSDKPVHPPFKLGNSKLCSVSSLTLIEYSSDKQQLWSVCPYAQAGLSLCWSHIPHCWKSHAIAHLCLKHKTAPNCHAEIPSMVVLVLAISVFPTLFGMTLVAHRPGCFTGGKLKIWNFYLESVFFFTWVNSNLYQCSLFYKWRSGSCQKGFIAIKKNHG